MPDITQSITYNEEEAFFRAKREPGLLDVAFTACPGVSLLMARSMDTRPVFKSTADRLKYKAKGMASRGRLSNGALSFEANIRLNRLTGIVKATAGTVSAIDNTPVDETSPARWQFSEYHQPVGVAHAHWKAAKAGGSVQRINLITEKSRSAYQDIVQEVAGDLYGTNTSTANGILSLSAGIGNSASDTTTYGGISRGTYGSWVGNYTARTAGNEDDQTATDYILRAMHQDSQTAVINGANPANLVFLLPTNLHSAVWDAFTGLNDSNTNALGARYDLKDGAGLPDIMYDGLVFGKIPIVHDPNIPTNKMYLVDTETSYFVGLNGAVFDMEDWNISENSTAFYSRVGFVGQFVVTAPRRNVISVYS